MLDRKYIEPYYQLFQEQYETIHRLETNKLRNIAQFFGHLLHSDAISWEVLRHIHLNEDETTSSSRVFIKFLLQEICEFMGIHKLNQRLQDPYVIMLNTCKSCLYTISCGITRLMMLRFCFFTNSLFPFLGHCKCILKESSHVISQTTLDLQSISSPLLA